MDRGLLVTIDITSTTQATRRNEEENHSVYDISDNTAFIQQDFVLAKNNAQGDNPASVKMIEDIKSFVYVYSPYSVEITIGDGLQEFVFPSRNQFIFPSYLQYIQIKNLSLDDPVLVKIVAT